MVRRIYSEQISRGSVTNVTKRGLPSVGVDRTRGSSLMARGMPPELGGVRRLRWESLTHSKVLGCHSLAALRAAAPSGKPKPDQRPRRANTEID